MKGVLLRDGTGAKSRNVLWRDAAKVERGSLEDACVLCDCVSV